LREHRGRYRQSVRADHLDNDGRDIDVAHNGRQTWTRTTSSVLQVESGRNGKVLVTPLPHGLLPLDLLDNLPGPGVRSPTYRLVGLERDGDRTTASFRGLSDPFATFTMTVDRTVGYLPVATTFERERDGHAQRLVDVEYAAVEDAGNTLFYPVRARREIRHDAEGNFKPMEEFEIDPSSLKINIDLPDDLFVLEPRAGELYVDAGRQVVLASPENDASAAVETGPTLEAVSPGPVDPTEAAYTLAQQQKGGGIGIWIAIGAAVLLLTVVAAAAYRQRRHTAQEKLGRWSGSPRARAGFTLVELLVVIGIIGLLLGLLLPVLSSSRGKARQVVCLSTLRSISQAMNLYANENGGYAFPSHAGLNKQPEERWPRLVLGSEFIVDGEQVNSDVLVCPSDPSGGSFGTQWQAKCSYLLNSHVVGIKLTGPFDTTRFSADRLVLLGERQHDAVGYYSSLAFSLRPDNQLADLPAWAAIIDLARHHPSGRSNHLFLDGHASNDPLKLTLDPAVYSPWQPQPLDGG
jgi:general secretion pathway protein G